MSTPNNFRILVINPNISTSVTESFMPIITKLGLNNASVTYWTASSGPSIIQTQAHLDESTLLCLPQLMELLPDYDGFLVACYADHPLTFKLQSVAGRKPIVGIFESSISTALSLLPAESKFGIITTGECWIELLSNGVQRYLGTGELTPEIFGGTFASGINLNDLRLEDQSAARNKVIQATRDLLSQGNISVICLGGAILLGMANWVLEAGEMEGESKNSCKVKVIDPLQAGILELYGLLQMGL